MSKPGLYQTRYGKQIEMQIGLFRAAKLAAERAYERNSEWQTRRELLLAKECAGRIRDLFVALDRGLILCV